MEYQTIEGRGNCWFAACNGAEGFRSFYADCFAPDLADRVYIVRGGPGTGKSRFLRTVSAVNREKGGENLLFACSSDPGSLDGVIMTLSNRSRLALLDGTPPHPYEGKAPGAREISVDFSAFWNREILQANREKILNLAQKKSDAYGAAYRWLHTAGEIDGVADEIRYACFDRERMRAKAEEWISRFAPRLQTPKEQIGLCDAIGMRGAVRLDTPIRFSEHLVLIRNRLGGGWMLLSLLEKIARREGRSVRLSFDPLNPKKLSCLGLTDSKTEFLLADGKEAVAGHPDCTVVDMEDFMRSSARTLAKSGLKTLQNGLRETVGAALENLRAAGDFHFALEEIYTSAMDFARKEEFTASFCREIFGGIVDNADKKG